MAMDICGVYQIKCVETGEKYIGSSWDIGKRWSQHRFQLRRGRHSSDALQCAWNKYGAGAFEFSVLEEVIDWEKRLSVEADWIRKLVPEYNTHLFVSAGKRRELRKSRIDERRTAWGEKNFDDPYPP